MDALVLEAVVAESAARLVEQEILRVSFLGRWRYLLRFSSPGHDSLLVSVRPEQPRLHLLPRAGGHPEAPPDRFAAILDRELTGARLAGIDLPPGERVVDLRFRSGPASAAGAGAERRLVAELFGRGANLYLLDPASIIVAWARDVSRGDRVPTSGRRYEHPPRRAPTGPPSGAPAAGGWSLAVRSRRPLESYREGDAIAADDLCVEAAGSGAPVADAGGAPFLTTRFASPSEAAAAALGLRERLRDFDEERARHATQARREAARLEGIVVRLLKEQDAGGQVERLRAWGEALLAGLSHARVEGGEAVVPDPSAPDGATLRIPIDPALSLKDNAQRLFDRYKKGKRTVVAIARRLEVVGGRLERWRDLERRADAARSQEDLRAVRDAMGPLGVVHAEAPARRRRAPAPAPRRDPARVRRHVTPDGFVILVGRSGDENDTLTFRVASPWDFWLHAADGPGAHVVVRNPGRLGSLPDSVLRTAAGLAAFYSAAKGSGRVEVHYTQRKHVQKRKGMPAGQVLLRRFRSIQVAPARPPGADADV